MILKDLKYIFSSKPLEYDSIDGFKTKKLYQKLVNSLAPQLGAQVKIMHDEGIEYYFLVKPGEEAQKIVNKVVKAYELKK